MPSLADPLVLPCGAVLPNRLAKSAMSEDLADEGHVPGERLTRLYRRWGHGGVGLLVTGNVMIDRTALGEPHNVVFDGQTALAPVAAWAAAAHEGGAHVWPQLNHPGRQSPRLLSKEPVAPSAVAMDLPGFRKPRALTAPEIEGLVAAFARAAAMSREAGFTGVQLHGAHGYLISQFLSPLANVRDDDWGGDAPRRRRFLVELVRAVRAAVGADFPIGVKLNSADFQRGGFEEEESMDVVVALEAEGVDLLEISGGTYEKPALMGVTREVRASTAAREAYFLDYARKVRARTRMPLLLTGGFRTRAGMEAALGDGAVDVIGLARPLALEPDLGRGLLDGSVTESRVEPRRTGIGGVDGFLEIAWYSYQLARMGDGEDPDGRVSPLRVLAWKGWTSVR